ncbi:preprotein translocase subunit SecE [Culicoidibacter larvae]|uniref:Preprotein translocase subunit SecE n=1 Tax=Culicoidibacter larvae TaxID=2579976 RepID=A0A5R8QH21_9FIRM|nr:preprotein translocase subunit SecE [Culicoidibacter larvae]TLG77282.1 preprotein translocase subunit SecE [Culicoidibacter larvae]
MSNVEQKRGIIGRMLHFPVEVVRELTKVEWISLGDLLVKTLTVLGFSAVLLIYFTGVDFVISEFLKIIVGIN